MAVETIREIFDSRIPDRLKTKPEIVEQIGASYKFVVEGDNGGTWVVDLTVEGGKVAEGDTAANCVISVQGQDLLDIVNGKLNGQMAFMSGKLKIAGDMALAMKLGTLLG